MGTVVQVGEPSVELAAVVCAVQAYLAERRVGTLSDADLVAELRCVEILRRKLEAGDVGLIGELDRRGLGAVCGARSTKGLVQDVLRVSPRAAHDRVDAAQMLGERVTISGEPLPPLLPATARAYEAGEISAEHVRSVIATVDDLPAELPAADFDEVDRVLAAVAVQCAPRDVTTAGIRILETLGARGHAPSEADQLRTRRLALHRRRDGSYELAGRLTPECGAETEAVLAAFAAPRPSVVDEDTGLPVAADDRTATQRMHDALQDLVGLALRADTLPITGRRAELIITGHAAPDAQADATTGDPTTGAATRDDHSANHHSANHHSANHHSANHHSANDHSANDHSRHRDPSGGDGPPGRGDQPRDSQPCGDSVGHHAREQHPETRPIRSSRGALGDVAWTSFGQAISARNAMWLCDTALVAIATISPDGKILSYGQTRRYATKAQIRALIARDGGCSFPGCDHPPEWCDAHHIVAWIDHGPTDIDNLTLLGGYHHRNFHRIGWRCRTRNGVPEWIPPPHIDRNQRPRRNLRYLLR